MHTTELPYLQPGAQSARPWGSNQQCGLDLIWLGYIHFCLSIIEDYGKMRQLQEVTAMLETVTLNPRYIEPQSSLPGHLALMDANGLPEGSPISKHIWLWNDKREKGFLFCLFALVFVFVFVWNRRF